MGGPGEVTAQSVVGMSIGPTLLKHSLSYPGLKATTWTLWSSALPQLSPSKRIVWYTVNQLLGLQVFRLYSGRVFM